VTRLGPDAAGEGSVVARGLELELRPGKAQGAFKTISEVADELDVAQHVLRFWESKFPQVRPMKRGGGRRYYRPEDVEALRQIRRLLYDEGYTIKGAQRFLKGRRARTGEPEPRQGELGGPLGAPAPMVEEPRPPPRASRRMLTAELRRTLERLRQELVELRDALAHARHHDP
jgi:DNA-binding transcriptional MerR regulator